jgi:hypothetical protein
MTLRIPQLIRSISVAVLLAAATLSLPAGAIDAAGKSCTLPKGVTLGDGSKVLKDGWEYEDGNTTYICDDGNLIIIIDEKLEPGTPPGRPLGPRVPMVGTGGAALSLR